MSQSSPSLTAAVYAKDASRLADFYAAWPWRGHLHLDGWDPEGNVFQLRQAVAA